MTAAGMFNREVAGSLFVTMQGFWWQLRNTIARWAWPAQSARGKCAGRA